MNLDVAQTSTTSCASASALASHTLYACVCAVSRSFAASSASRAAAVSVRYLYAGRASHHAICANCAARGELRRASSEHLRERGERRRPRPRCRGDQCVAIGHVEHAAMRSQEGERERADARSEAE